MYRLTNSADGHIVGENAVSEAHEADSAPVSSKRGASPGEPGERLRSVLPRTAGWADFLTTARHRACWLLATVGFDRERHERLQGHAALLAGRVLGEREQAWELMEAAMFRIDRSQRLLVEMPSGAAHPPGKPARFGS